MPHTLTRSPHLRLIVLCLFVSFAAHAATHVWTGAGDDYFSNASNWIGGSPVGDASAAISFPASSRPAATNDLNGLTVQSIAFSAGGFTISGNPITLVANATVIDTSQGINTISCNLVLGGDIAVAVNGNIYDGKSLTLSGVIAGMGGINYVLGYKHYYEDGFASGAGFLGIAVALVGRNHPFGVLAAAFFFATLSQGGLAIHAFVPKQMMDVLQGVVIIAVATSVPEVRRALRSARRTSDA